MSAKRRPTFADESVSALETVGSEAAAVGVAVGGGRPKSRAVAMVVGGWRRYNPVLLLLLLIGRDGWRRYYARLARRPPAPSVEGQHQSGFGAVVAQRSVAVAARSLGRHRTNSAVGRRPLVDFAPVQVQIQRQMITISAPEETKEKHQ